MTTLLFVHIGTDYPKYLIKNIERTRDLFQNRKIVLVGDISPNYNWLKKNDIYFKKHEVNYSFDEKFSFSEFEENFRSGYWRHTLERLLSLENYHRDFPEEKLIHIESDVIIFPNFPFEMIRSLTKVTWINHSSSADIAALVYSPNWQASNKFSNQLIEEYSEGGGSDMDVLLRLRQKNPDFAILPTLNAKTQNFVNSSNKNIIDLGLFELKNCPGIFDALGIGMWISGVDPRNKFGFTVIHSRELIDSGTIFLDPSKMQFTLSEEGNLLVISNGTKVPIYNLHIHSKDKDLLSINWRKRLSHLILQGNSKTKTVGFSALILTRLTITNLRQKSFINFILQVPIIRKIRSQLKNR